MSRSALDCVQRGFLSLRANSGLVWMGVLQSLLFAVLFLLSLLPPLMVVGGAALMSEDLSDAAALEHWLTDLGPQLANRLPSLALGLLASLLIGLLAVVVWSWFQGGMMGVLLAAERQAHPEAGHRAGGWQWFRTFSFGEFSGWGARNLWPFFWFFHLMLTLWTLLAVGFIVLVGGAGLAYEAWGGGAAFGLGCGGAIPFLFLGWVLTAWTLVAQPAVAFPSYGAWKGSVVGFRVVGRRLGATSLMLFLSIVVSIVIGLLLTMAQFTIELVLPSEPVIEVGVYLLSTIFQWVVGSVITVFLLAVFTALVVAETGTEDESR